MVKLCTLAAAGVLLSGCRLGVAGPDDEQVLVQRATFVQPKKALDLFGTHPEVAEIRSQIGGLLRGAVGQVKSEMVRLQGEQVVNKRHQGNNTFGKEGEVCSTQDMTSYEDAVKAFTQMQRASAIKFVKHFGNQTIRALEKMVHPLLAASKAIFDDLGVKAKTPVLNMLKYQIAQAAKPAKKYDASDIVPSLEASGKEIEQVVRSSQKQWQAMISKSWKDLDVLLNTTAKDMPVIADLHLPTGMSPWIDWENHGTNLGEYWAVKAAPMVIAEALPMLQEPTKLFLNLPKKQEDQLPYMMTEVFPAMQVFGKNAKTAIDEAFPERSNPPTRTCLTCDEKYKSEVTQVGGDSCMEHCLAVIAQCAPVTDAACMQTTRYCLKCHTEKLANLDTCKGVATNEKRLTALREIIDGLQYAVNQQGFDKVLVNMTENIVKGK